MDSKTIQPLMIPIRLSLPTKAPTKAHPFDAAFDLYAPEPFSIAPGETKTVNLGVHFEIPDGYYGQVAGRSSLAKLGLSVLGGVVDSGYTGPVHAILHNLSQYDRKFEAYDRVCQIIFLPVVNADLRIVEEFAETERGSKGFGSSGR